MLKAVKYSRQALRTLERIDRRTSERIRAKVRQLATDPQVLAANIRPLKGSGGLMRLRVCDWRVIYAEDLVVLLVVRVAPRGSACE